MVQAAIHPPAPDANEAAEVPEMPEKPGRKRAAKPAAPAEAPPRKPAPLEAYAAKRDFTATPEPDAARVPASAGPARIFVVQMHRATRLHWDFRLEADGVLKSWAVPRGPSMRAGEKRLAMHVEDHPYDYRDFEGKIPKGNYGAGEVIVWDRGVYALYEGTDPTAEIAKGKLKFVLAGERLRGLFTLVQMHGREAEENAWLLLKDHDDLEDADWRIEDFTTSAVTGRTLAEIAADPAAASWRSKDPADDALPDDVSPMLATPVDRAFDDRRWGFEIKWDGYRTLCTIARDGSVRFRSRSGTSFDGDFPELEGIAAAFRERPLVLDGEIVVLDERGHPSFSSLQRRLDRFGRAGKRADLPATFVAFDLLYAGGRDLRAEPLAERKRRLEELAVAGHGVIVSKHVVGSGRALFESARSEGLEGIVGKRLDSPYRSQRSRDWVKIKVRLRQECVIIGWAESPARAASFRSLILGLYEGDALVYIGSVGSGFDERLLAGISQRLREIEIATPPLRDVPKLPSRAHWVKPELVAEIEFAEWTSDGLLRQAVFIALRSDRDPRSCVRETPRPLAEVVPEEAPPEKAPPKSAAPKKAAPKAAVPEHAPQAKPHEAAAPALRAAHAKSGKESSLQEIGGRSLAITNRSKVLWPRDGFTKGDLIDYYRAVAGWIVPFLRGRPLTLERYPNGIDESSFFEKHAPRGIPAWVRTAAVASGSAKGGKIDFVVCDDEATLVYLANLAAIVLHAWTSRLPALDHPDFMLFDIDPWEGCTLATLARVTLAFGEALREIGLTPLVKTSGGSGFHVVVPLAGGYTYAIVKMFAELVARRVNALHPKLTTLERMTAKRPHGTVYLDYVQVGEGKTVVAPYSVRANPGAPVSMPLAWEALAPLVRRKDPDATKTFAAYTIATAPGLLQAQGDAWGGEAWAPQHLEDALAKARRLWVKE
jgi:bifunctional non-homologous end joining protein LigD